MYCNNCGEKLPDGSAFCNSCGAKLNAAPDNENSNKNSDPAPKPNEGIMGKLASGREAKNRKD